MRKFFIVSPFESEAEGRGTRNLCWKRNVSRDFEVIFITTDWSHSRKKKLFHDKSYENLKVISIPGYDKNISLKRVISHWIFCIKLFIFLVPRAKKDDIILTSTIPPEMLLVSLAMKILGCKIVSDVRDLWPLAFKGTKLPFGFAKFYNQFFRLIGHTDHIVTPIPSFKEKLEIDFRRTVELMPLGWSGVCPPSELSALPGEARKKLSYIGNLSHLSNLDKFLDSEESNEFEITIVGDGEKRSELERKFKTCNVNFLGQIEKNEVPEHLEGTSFLLLPFFSDNALPNKFFDTFRYGIPSLSYGSSDTSRLIEELGIGVTGTDANDALRKALNLDPVVYEKLLSNIRNLRMKYHEDHLCNVLLSRIKL